MMRSDDCATGLHDDCSPCDCLCHTIGITCSIHQWWDPMDRRCPYCVERDGLKADILTGELLDLITLMPDSQCQAIIDHINELRIVRARQHVDTKTNI